MQGDATITVELLETSGCRLCGEAEAIVRTVLKRRRCVLQAVEIVGDPLLERGYAARIPVLRRKDSGAELDWPFGPEEVYRFLL
ncbi:MAG: glutaredoxin family protein [Nitrococcus mobilis]|nr:glutaredoxin family protein [Nitrococcus mobilis]